MKNYSHVLFDLDGTLSDPGLGITNAVIHALGYYDIQVESRSSLYPFIGPPLYASFMKFFGFSEETAHQAVEHYREHYAEIGLYENTLYKNVEKLLIDLKKQGKTLLVASSKPEIFVRKILDHFGLSGYFHLIGGATLDKSRVEKSAVIAYVLKEGGITDPSCAIMVGDREHDVLGAKACGLDCIGVVYGYGDAAELTQAGAVALAESPDDLGRILLNT